MFIPNRDSAGNPIYAMDKSAADFDTIITHNFCDNTTWEISTSDSTWKLEPAAGEIVRVIKAEVQFEHDLDIDSDLYLDYYVWHPSSPGTPILGKRITFEHVRNIFELGNEHYHAPSFPGITTGLSTVVFSYAHKLQFYGDETAGELAYLQLSLEGHTEPTGTYATVGFVTETVVL